MISYGKLNFNYPLEEIKEEVTMLLNKNWQKHYNKAHYTGDWEVFSILQDIEGFNSIFAEQLHFQPEVEEKLICGIPNLTTLVSNLKCHKKSIRLLNLKAGAVIKSHKDADLAYEKGEARLHLPIFTNPQVNFVLDEKRLDMLEGECWYINANLTHKANNAGNADRIHLVIDCVVNDWLKKLFGNSTVVTKVNPMDFSLQKSIIAELRLQNTIGALELANTLESEIKPK